MSFRDDRDALLARTAALEREAEKLWRENDALREEAEAKRKYEAEFAELEREEAAKRVEIERMAARSPSRRPPKPAKPRKPRPTGRFGDLLVESLSPTWSKVTWVVGVLALPPSMVGWGFALAVALDAAWLDGPGYVIGPIGFALLLGGFVGYLFGLDRDRVPRTRAGTATCC